MLQFTKYHGAGNDFLLVDDREATVDLDTAAIATLCARRLGVGADGLILLRPDDTADVRMIYFNADGRESTMCGNGGRCLAHFAHAMGAAGEEMSIRAIDGIHTARLLDGGARVRLSMSDVGAIEDLGDGRVFLDTGSPHVVERLDRFPDDFVAHCRSIRMSDRFRADGVNVNVLVRTADERRLRTYERGVEDETLSCGTGAVAAALTILRDEARSGAVGLRTPGGILTVEATRDGHTGRFGNIHLEGPVHPVFHGRMEGGRSLDEFDAFVGFS